MVSEEDTCLKVMSKGPLGPVLNMVVNLPLSLRKDNFLNNDMLWRQWNQRCSIRRFHFLSSPQNKRLQYSLYNVESPEEILGLERYSDERLPEGEVAPGLDSQEPNQTEQIL